MTDEQFEVTLWHRGGEELFVWSDATVRGERAPFVPEEKEAEFRQFLQKLDRGVRNQSIETVRRDKDGNRIVSCRSV